MTQQKPKADPDHPRDQDGTFVKKDEAKPGAKGKPGGSATPGAKTR